MEPKQILPSLVSVDLRVMTMKGYFTFPRSTEQEPHYQIPFSVRPKTPLLVENIMPLLWLQSAYSMPIGRVEQGTRIFIPRL